MTTPPGWYDDGHGAQRWWDGQGWTEHVAPPAPGAGAPTASALAADQVGSYPAAGSLGAAVAGQTGSPQASGPVGTAAAQAMPSGAAEGAPKRPFPLWIVFVVLGLLLAGLVAAAAIFLPRLFSTLEAGGEHQAAAVAAVERYDQAWTDADCDAYFATTTASYRQAMGMTDCRAFETTMSEFRDSTEGYTLTVTAVRDDGDAVMVETTETYRNLLDDGSGATPTDETVHYRYTVISGESGWAIDGVEEQ